MRIDLDALLAAAPSPFLLLDRELRIIWANDAYLATTGRTREQLIGRVLTEEFPAPADSVPDQMLRASFRRVLATGRIDHLPLIPYPITGPDGQPEDRYWSATHTPIKDAAGEVEFILQNANDVTLLYRDAGLHPRLRKQISMLLRLKFQVQHPAPSGHRMLRWTNDTSTSTARNVA